MQPSFVITFDDGYLDNWHWAVPALQKRNLRAIFFVVTGSVGLASGGQRRMSWSHLIHLAKSGHLIGSHSVTHRPLTVLSPAQAARELVMSMAIIRERTPMKASLFAYPYGHKPAIISNAVDYVGFGTTRAKARPWSDDKRDIRRTYLPFGKVHSWRALVRKWRIKWSECESV